VVINDLIGSDGGVLHLCNKLGGCVQGLLGWALFRAVSHILASEASSFFYAVLLIFI
jgi:hypothetical protein